jgi:hypothetical protein
MLVQVTDWLKAYQCQCTLIKFLVQVQYALHSLSHTFSKFYFRYPSNGHSASQIWAFEIGEVSWREWKTVMGSDPSIASVVSAVGGNVVKCSCHRVLFSTFWGGAEDGGFIFVLAEAWIADVEGERENARDSRTTAFLPSTRFPSFRLWTRYQQDVCRWLVFFRGLLPGVFQFERSKGRRVGALEWVSGLLVLHCFWQRGLKLSGL